MPTEFFLTLRMGRPFFPGVLSKNLACAAGKKVVQAQNVTEAKSQKFPRTMNSIFALHPVIRPMAVAFVLSVLPSPAVVLLSTDFTGMSIDGTNPNQANGISWTGTALSAPSTLTLENVTVVQNDGELFDSANDVTTTNGYFGGNTNISSGTPSIGQWGTTVQLTVGSMGVTLEDIALNLVHATNSGTIQQNPRDTNVLITVRDTSDLSVVGTGSQVFSIPGNAASGLDGTVSFAAALNLSAGGVYDVEFLVDSDTDNAGHYAAFGSMAFNGAVIPEPSTGFLVGILGLLALLHRRR